MVHKSGQETESHWLNKSPTWVAIVLTTLWFAGLAIFAGNRWGDIWAMDPNEWGDFLVGCRKRL